MWLRRFWLFLLLCEICDLSQEDAFDAIKGIHSHLDDDNDGKIDQTETLDYMNTELDTPGDITRQKSFHTQKTQVSVEDLWKKWEYSEVYHWDTETVIIWLKKHVDLPEYEAVFRKHNVGGKDMPQLATPKTRYLQDVLKVTDPSHRKKIYLRATDVVLFGPPDLMKDVKKPVDKNFEAIKAVHAHLDDDQNGDIDVTESHGYMKEELLADTADKRHSAFHFNDALISVDDLWMSWQKSEVYNWTTDQVINWLKVTVGLPQYESNFRKKKIDGKCIPRLATEKSTYVLQELEVMNPKHRRKIYLRASDIILFGPPEVSHSHLNDTIVLIVVLLSTFVCFYSYREKRRTHLLVENMTKDMESLQQAEMKLSQMQEKLGNEDRLENIGDTQEREKKLLEEIEAAKREATRLHTERSKNQEDKIKLSLVEQELSEVRVALAKAEAEMRLKNKANAPLALRQLLQATYHKEIQYFQFKKQKALSQMQEAKDACDKVSKTRRSMFGSLRLAHDQSIDTVDQKILDAKSALAEVTNDLQERQNRWCRIEEICSFQLLGDTNTNIANLNKEPNNSSELVDLPPLKTLGRSNSSDSISRSNNSGSSIRKTDASLPLALRNEFCCDVDYTDTEIESLSFQKISLNPIHDSPSDTQKSNEFSQGSSQDMGTAGTVESRYSPVTFDNTPRSTSFAKVEGLKMLRSTSNQITPRVTEKYIVRAYTEPSDLKGMALAQETCGSDPVLCALPHHTLTNGRTTQQIINSKDDSGEFEANNTLDSDQEDFVYTSDESRTSSIKSNTSSAKKKHRKPFSKLFSRRSTKNKMN